MPGLWTTLCVCWLVYSLIHQLRGTDRTNSEPLSTFYLWVSLPLPLPLQPCPLPRELLLARWWKRRACWAVGVSPHAAGQHLFDLHIQMGANSSAMPPLGAIMSCHPCRCQVGVWWCGGGLCWSFTLGSVAVPLVYLVVSYPLLDKNHCSSGFKMWPLFSSV